MCAPVRSLVCRTYQQQPSVTALANGAVASFPVPIGESYTQDGPVLLELRPQCS
jgi:hypothetical protein